MRSDEEKRFSRLPTQLIPPRFIRPCGPCQAGGFVAEAVVNIGGRWLCRPCAKRQRRQEAAKTAVGPDTIRQG